MRTKIAENPKQIAIQLINHIPEKKLSSVIDFLQYILQISKSNFVIEEEKADVKSLAKEIRAGLKDVDKIQKGKAKAKSARDFLNAI